LWRWYYQLGNWPKTGRERQVKKGSYCHTVLLRQGEEEIVLFAFVSGRESELLRGIASFYSLPVAQVYNTSFTGRIQAYRSPTGRPEIPGSLLIGEERAYWRGEKARWHHGRELTPADFHTVLTHLATVQSASPE
jgi:hypothetical protein